MSVEMDPEKLRSVALEQFNERQRELSDLLSNTESELIGDCETPKDSDIAARFDRVVLLARQLGSIAMGIAYIDGIIDSVEGFDQRQLADRKNFDRAQEEERKKFLGGESDAIVIRFSEAGIELPGLEAPHPEQAVGNQEEEARKAREIERIRRNMGNLEAFKTGDEKVDKRLDEQLEDLSGAGLSMRAGFMTRFDLKHLPTIADFLSHTPEEILPARNWGPKRIDKVLARLYEKGIMPVGRKIASSTSGDSFPG